ncbi:hypothetical protein VI06_19720 [Aquitalea magnusonii]|nr:hypothetical protein VI06_19720 [Aquitalea magnusonii]
MKWHEKIPAIQAFELLGRYIPTLIEKCLPQEFSHEYSANAVIQMGMIIRQFGTTDKRDKMLLSERKTLMLEVSNRLSALLRHTSLR